MATATVEARNLVSTPNDAIEALQLSYEIWRTDTTPAESLRVITGEMGNSHPGTYSQFVSYSSIKELIADGFTAEEATDMAIDDAVNAKLTAEAPQEPEARPVGMPTPSRTRMIHDPNKHAQNEAKRQLRRPFQQALEANNCQLMYAILYDATVALGADDPKVAARRVDYIAAGYDA